MREKSLYADPTLFRSTGFPPLADPQRCLVAVLKASLPGFAGAFLLFFHRPAWLGPTLTEIGALFTLSIGLTGMGIGMYAEIKGQRAWRNWLLVGALSVAISLYVWWPLWRGG